MNGIHAVMVRPRLHGVKSAGPPFGAPPLSCENHILSSRPMQFLNTLTVLALVVASFALIVAVPVLYASSQDSGRSNRLILLGSAVWVALVLLNWGVSFFVV